MKSGNLKRPIEYIWWNQPELVASSLQSATSCNFFIFHIIIYKLRCQHFDMVEEIQHALLKEKLKWSEQGVQGRV